MQRPVRLFLWPALASGLPLRQLVILAFVHAVDLTAEPAAKTCMSQANDIILAPYYGRNPTRGSWSFAQSSVEMPDSWTSSSYAMTFEVQSHLLTGYVDTCNGPSTCQQMMTPHHRYFS